MPEQQQMMSPFAREVIDVPVTDEMSESFLAYSLSVITARAIPDGRDGLKPVQRRILYSMLNLGLRPQNPHRKCAGVVGDTMGKYHPHGDSAIYEALVRMGQDFSRNVTFVDPQGNFGSLDDPPAAYRYTECRLTEAAMEMIREIDEDTVDFRPSFDGEREEPVCLPGLVPNLLVNGTSGIAVGMATNMPTHNLREVYEAIKLVMTKRRPKPTIDELLAVLPGPDFPTGAIVVDDGLRDAYETGRGSVRMRAKAEIEQLTHSRQAIVITELPFQVGPERVIAKIQELVRNEKIAGIDDFKNLSDRHVGLRIQIECKPHVNPQAVLGELYRMTPLEETFGINNVVLVDNVPTTVGLYELCSLYVDHRLDVVVRRTEYRLGRARDRLHIVEGLLIALDAIDEVVAIIRGSDDVAEAREGLMVRFELSETQATHILDMPLRRLTALAKLELTGERDELLVHIDDYERLLSSEQRRRTTVLRELEELVELYATDRRTEIVTADELPTYDSIEVLDTAELTDEPCIVSLSASGQIGRAPTEGAKRATPGRHDALVDSVLTSTAATIAAVTTEGRVLTRLVAEIGDAAGRARGDAAAHVFGTNKGEDVLSLVAPGGTEPLVVITAGGIAKRVAADEVLATRSGGPIIKLKAGDRIAAAFRAPPEVDVIIVASDAEALRTPASGISEQGRGAGGVAGMKLKGDAVVVAAGPVLGDDVVIAVSSGAVKTTPADEIPAKGRGAGGVRLMKLAPDDPVTTAYIGSLLGLLAVMSTDEDHRKVDPMPIPAELEISRRDLAPATTERQILGLGPARW